MVGGWGGKADIDQISQPRNSDFEADKSYAELPPRGQGAPIEANRRVTSQPLNSHILSNPCSLAPRRYLFCQQDPHHNLDNMTCIPLYLI
jgi:hypothetical protein